MQVMNSDFVYLKISLFGSHSTIRLLEENIGRTLFDINRCKIFVDPPPRVMKIKTKLTNRT